MDNLVLLGEMAMTKNEWNYEIFWKEAITQVHDEISEQEYMMWFRYMAYRESNNSQVVLSVPSSFYRDQIIQRYVPKLESKLLELSGQNIKIKFHIDRKGVKSKTRKKKIETTDTPPPIHRIKKKKHPQLKREYTFDRFIVGENNSFASNAAFAIAKNPGTGYNPCLIYGGVGLGKTHLIQAIGNSAYEDSDGAKIVYVTAETFANEFIYSIQNQSGHLFKNKYRSVDILLIDDIHFLQGKEGTQEELFHTFNALYDANKQMVFTSDRPVSDLQSLSDRLRSRFERGLNVDLLTPDYETRIAILKRKIEEKSVDIPDEVVELICTNVTTNVRDIEKALTKLIAYAELVNRNITFEIAQRELKDLFTIPNQKNISLDVIQRIVADYFGLSYSDIRGKKRTRAIAIPRQIAMHIARQITDYSTTEVGTDFGGRDHTTVIHACQKVEERMLTDPTLEPTIQHLIREIKNR